MNISKMSTAFALVGGLAVSASAFASGINITPSLKAVDVLHGGKPVTIERTSDKNATIPLAYAKVSRACPPFCVQPMTVASGVDTVGELEVLGYLKRISNGDRSVMVVDSRESAWVNRGTIPGAVNTPWNMINVDVAGTFEVEAEAEGLHDILINKFGAKLDNGHWDFRNAKTLVLFCNGIWCPQSSINIKTLVKMGYPAYKLKWYRGGVQSWVSVGLTTVKP
ncbi:rhodanese-like domain-containing protein [Solemya velesiana gill symbiont]|uniref:Sulfurtransferase n=1 Tax=Solemya velesiana gill symbiont TaxID=1918948 RepID=A0A1T2KUG5_9GAMM|nr:rhodanese-like domain-containing protein [Solemya velesiana gill symbiont]OOZ36370.1 sulfurtransferase [Solemya velesiana gill symbiont]